MGSSNIDEAAMDEQDIPTYASSLPVPNVQEMVRENPLHVPERYIRNHEDMPKSTDATHLSSKIPVIDLLLLSSGRKEELKKLDLACQEWGFFQVVNHSVTKEVVHNFKDATAEFFDLPLEEKNMYAMASNDIQGYGHAYVVSEEQKLDWSDALILITYPSKYRRLRFWPTTPTGFKEITEAYANELRRVAEELIGSISLIMGMDKSTLLAMHKELMQGMRLNYYPTCNKPDQVLGISPHSDTSTITILHQDENVNGLQIRHGGEWVPVNPIENALVVNIGDVIEVQILQFIEPILSNGKYKSIEHRAVTNENKARISFATFFIPNDDVELEPLDNLVDPKTTLRMYKKVRYGDYLRQSMKSKLQGKAHTEMAKNGT
ncbi:2-oxoglutarate-dependent dioxygenase 11-like [Cornus florida]|uniref:2-oxoglutarate-dependent dioxygenase 11-like n=1 Tax=Cornus florida TaxID=4283 RepID=UPI00289EC170|nr:2-oxoglutarate-dependent dioxygenase 11-like [Cornus florida]